MRRSDRHLGLDLARTHFGRGTRPFKLTLIVTEKCHLRCAMCRLWESPSSGPTLAELDRLFARNDWFSWINLSGGELLSRADIDAVLTSLVRHERRLSVLDFPTAGQDPDRTEQLVRHLLALRVPRVFVTVSIDGPRDVHDAVRGVSGSFDRALETLRRLRALRARGLRVCAGFTLSHANANALPATVQSLLAAVPKLSPTDIHLNIAHHSPHYYKNAPSVRPPTEVALAALESLPVARDALGLVEWLFRRHAKQYLANGRSRMACHAIDASIFVGANLDVHACSTWDHPLGNLRATDMALAPLLAAPPSHSARAIIARRECPGCCTACDTFPSLLAHMPAAIATSGAARRTGAPRALEPAS